MESDLYLAVPAIVLSCLLSDFVARKLNLPIFRMLGPIVLTAGLKLAGLGLEIPGIMKDAIPFILGVYIGMRFKRDTAVALGNLLIPSVLLVLVYVGLSLGYGFALYTFAFLPIRWSDTVHQLILFVVGALGSWLFTLIRFPGGAMIRALLFVGVYCVLLPKRVAYPPIRPYHAAQIAMGVIIGSSFSGESLLKLRRCCFRSSSTRPSISFLVSCWPGC